nr:UDP-N-acetylmuramoyl-L-alanine--D-glutamate ligase [Pseudohoeflea sp. DP4N28-3]
MFGLGGSGLATALALQAGGAVLSTWDDNPEQVARAKAHGIATDDLHDLDWALVDSLVLSPGVPLTHPKPHWTVGLAQANSVEIIGDVEIFVRERRAFAPGSPFIAVTGTNGKSTTTALIAHILAASGRDTQMGGNIGTPVLALEEPGAERFHVVECSSYQIELAPSLDPTAGILLNLTPDHLDRHGTMQRYAAIKEQLVARSDIAIVGVDDAYCSAIAARLDDAGHAVIRLATTHTAAALSDGLVARDGTVMRVEAGRQLPVADLSQSTTLRGRHNGQNAAAAIAACQAVGLSDDEIGGGLESFPGLKHRMQPVARRGAVLFVNDSKATNAEAAAPALSSYEQIYWIAGGLAKDGGIAALEPLFPRLAKAYLIGEAASAFASIIGAHAPFEISGTIEQAVAQAAQDADAAAQDAGGNADASPVVLLSPACASFDQFRNFEVRGDAFVRQIAQIEGIEMLVDHVDEGKS